jgi:phosphoenolpyruvate synthase/pyruvate phosphate dikinase
MDNFLKGVRSISFWARELRLPLFWLTDPDLKIFSDEALLFRKGPIMHFYHLNDKEKRAANYGFNFFTNPKNVEKYKNQAEKILVLIRETSDKFRKIDLKRLSDEEFKNLFLSYIKGINSYGNVYARTEEFYLRKIEQEQEIYKDLIEELGKIRFNLRKKGEILFYILLGVLIKEISRRSGEKVSDLFLYTFDELLDIFKNKKLKKEILKERQKGYVVLALKRKYYLITGEKFQKIFKEVVKPKKNIKEFSGFVAMKGFAIGKARILTHDKRDISSEVKKFKRGEVLVTEMTRPDTIMACKRAIAIVTDEGGITSHAAILSREFKIPCIIGTKIATQILRNGDLIEVDANKGTVKVLK